MRFRSGKRRQGFGTYFAAALGTFLIVLVVLFHQFIGGMLGGLLALASAHETDTYALLPKNVLASRLKDAEMQLARVRYESVLYASLVEENNALMQTLGLPGITVAARGRVLARPPRTHYDTLLVQTLDTASIAVGDYTYAEGVLIGYVTERNAETVLVSLFSAPGATLDVRVGSPSAIVVAHGLGGGAFTFDVPKEVAIKIGDGIENAHGEGGVIGVVQQVIDEPERTSFRIYAATPVSMNDMDVVEFVRALPEVNAL